MTTAQTVDIPDANLRAAVESELTLFGKAIGDPITVVDMATLIIIEASNANISDLTGLEYATNLHSLFLEGNTISDLSPLSGLTSLTFLRLQDNLISDISPLSGLSSLIFLELQDNAISDLSPLLGNTGLGAGSKVNVSKNPLSDLSIHTHIPTLQSRGVEVLFDFLGQVSFSELMLTSKEGPDSLPEWIELYNNSATETMNLKGWQLQIEARDATGAHRHAMISLEDLPIPSNQTALIVTSPGRNSGDFPDDRIYNFFDHHSDVFEQEQHRNMMLGQIGFYLKLSDPEGVISDVAGNLDGDAATTDQPAWKLPAGITEDSARTSLLRRYNMKKDTPRDGTVSTNWVRASERKLSANTYWGKITDKGNPGYRKENVALPVQLSSFRPEKMDNGVVINWTTESELDNAGFNILQSQTRSGPFVKVNPKLIQGAGTTGERNTYTWTDPSAKSGVVYYYQIEDVSFAGVRQVLATTKLKGLISAKNKLTTRWGDLKSRD